MLPESDIKVAPKTLETQIELQGHMDGVANIGKAYWKQLFHTVRNGAGWWETGSISGYMYLPHMCGDVKVSQKKLNQSIIKAQMEQKKQSWNWALLSSMRAITLSCLVLLTCKRKGDKRKSGGRQSFHVFKTFFFVCLFVFPVRQVILGITNWITTHHQWSSSLSIFVVW